MSIDMRNNRLTMARRTRPTQRKDWHPEEIKAAIRMRGSTLTKLGKPHGYNSRAAVSAALRRPWPKLEAIIAEFLGMQPETIWPSRYEQRGEQ
jgi:Ner family transcriptional regulator